MAAAGAEAAAVAAAEEEEEKQLPEGDPESGGDSEDEGDSESSGDGEDEEKENEAEIQRLEEQVGPGWAGGGVGRRRWWGSTAASARSKPLTRGRWRWRPGRALRRWPARVAMRDASAPGLRGRLVPENQGLSSWRPDLSRVFLFVTACWNSYSGNWKKKPNSVTAPVV